MELSAKRRPPGVTAYDWKRGTLLDLRNRVVLITGASDGIGAACADAFRKRGCRLSLSGLPSDAFRSGRRSNELTTAGDITDPAVRGRIVSETLAAFGSIDVLVNNAAVGLYAPPSTVPVELSKRIFDVNVFAAASLTQEALPSMLARGTGTVVNVGSVGGYVSLPWAVMYCASKFALHAYSDSLRRELRGSGISVLKVCPGIVDTQFREHVLAGTAPVEVQKISRVVTADRVAEAIVRGLRRSRRQVYVPWIGRVFTAMDHLAPGIMDWYLEGKR